MGKVLEVTKVTVGEYHSFEFGVFLEEELSFEGYDFEVEGGDDEEFCVVVGVLFMEELCEKFSVGGHSYYQLKL